MGGAVFPVMPALMHPPVGIIYGGPPVGMYGAPPSAPPAGMYGGSPYGPPVSMYAGPPLVRTGRAPRRYVRGGCPVGIYGEPPP